MIKVLCVGSIYVDINFLDFPCEHGLQIEEEAIGRDYEVKPGGSAPNFARFGKMLGLETILAGKLGRDPLGKVLSKLMADSGVTLSLMEDEEELTNVGINFVAADGASVMAVAGSASRSLTEEWVSNAVDTHVEDVSHIYLGSAFKLPHLLPYFLTLTKKLTNSGVNIILDHGKVPMKISHETRAQMRSLAGSADVYLPSRKEFLDLWEADNLDAAAENVINSGSGMSRVVIVKDGPAGAVGFSADGRTSISAYNVPVRSTVGAGDSFNAGFLRASTLGQSFEESIDFACATSAVTISGADPTITSVSAMRKCSRIYT